MTPIDPTAAARAGALRRKTADELIAEQENLLAKLAERGAAMPDLATFDAEIRARRGKARADLLRGLAAQYAGPEFEHVQRAFLQRSNAADAPIQAKGIRQVGDRAEIDPLYKHAIETGNLELLAKIAGSRAERAAAAEDRAAEAEAKRKFEEDQRERERQLRRDLAAQAAADRAAMREAMAANAEQKEIDNRTERLAKQIAAGGIDELDQSLSVVEEALRDYEGKDLPGFGPVAGALPDFMVSEEGKRLRQAYAAVRNAILKARSGGAVTEGEARRMLQELGEGFGRGDDLARKGIENARNIVEARKRNLAAGAGERIVEEYEARGGTPLRAARSSAPSPRTPRVGDIQEDEHGNRYRFKGGDPADRSNWERIR